MSIYNRPHILVQDYVDDNEIRAPDIYTRDEELRMPPYRRTYGRPSRYSGDGRVRVLGDWRRRNKATRAAQYAVARTQGVNRYRSVRTMRNATGFPRQMRMNHKFVAIVRRTGIGGSLNKFDILANGMKDPLGTTHDPIFYSNMSAIYNHYVVIGSKITVETHIDTADPDSPVRVGIFRNDDSTTSLTTVQQIMEQTSGNGELMTATDTYRKKVYGNYSAKAIFGPNPESNSELKCTGLGAPQETVYWTLGAQRDGASAVNIDITYTITIRYAAVWFEPKDQPKNT